MNADEEGENVLGTSGKRVRLTGNALLARMQEFLGENDELMGSIAEVEKEGLPLLGAMSSHPPMATYIEDGYTIITF